MKNDITIYTLNELPIGKIDNFSIKEEPGVIVLSGIWQGCSDLALNDLSYGILLKVNNEWYKGFFLSIRTADEVRVKILCISMGFKE